MRDKREQDPAGVPISASDELEELEDGGVEAAPEAEMLRQLSNKTGTNFCVDKDNYLAFITNAQIVVQETEFFALLSDLHIELSEEFVVGKIRAVEAWANGNASFRVVSKPWGSVIDKLFRINIEENGEGDSPPLVRSISDQADKRPEQRTACWVTPANAHEFTDDLLRTKFVVPFVDGVMDVSQRIIATANDCNLRWFQRYHAKDSGYHAHHVYVLLPVPGWGEGEAHITLEIKVLTKLQDNLGELTHLLYELKRTGKLKAEKKRKLAWMLDSPDFAASYVGHSAHYIEAAMVGLKGDLARLEKGS